MSPLLTYLIADAVASEGEVLYQKDEKNIITNKYKESFWDNITV